MQSSIWDSQPTVKNSICDLPVELLIMIFQELDIQTLFRCKAVCRLFKDIDDVRLQYKIELALAGMEDGPPSHLTPRDRIEMLRARQKAWSTLTWTSEETIAVEGHSWELFGGILAQADGPSSIVFRQLPSKFRGLESFEWRVDKLNFVFMDFAMDRSLDLLVAIEMEHSKIHLCSLTTGEPHPLASNPVIQVVQHDSSDVDQAWIFKVRNSGSFIGVLTSLDFGRLLVFYNWRTGERVLELNEPTPACFAFLTDDLVMVASLGATPLHASLSIYDLNLTPTDAGICTFLLPQVRDQSSMLTTTISIGGDQSCLWVPHSSLKVPFFTSHKNKLFAITYSSNGEACRLFYVFFVPISTILKHVHAIQAGEADCNIIPWDEWGVRGARFLHPEYNPSSSWVRCAYGQEYVMGDQYLPPRGYKTVRLYDFNSLSLKRALSSVGHTDDRKEIIADTTGVEVETFEFPIFSSLPYQVRTVQLPARRGDGMQTLYTAMMLTEDALVAVSRAGTRFHTFTF